MRNDVPGGDDGDLKGDVPSDDQGFGNIGGNINSSDVPGSADDSWWK